MGHYVSNTSHHKHSYYVVVNSDMPGFTERERLLVAALCRYHRKTLPSTVHTAYQTLTAEERRMLLLLIPLLRLADNMVRSPKERIQKLECRVQNGDVVLAGAFQRRYRPGTMGRRTGQRNLPPDLRPDRFGNQGARLICGNTRGSRPPFSYGGWRLEIKRAAQRRERGRDPRSARGHTPSEPLPALVLRSFIPAGRGRRRGHSFPNCCTPPGRCVTATLLSNCWPRQGFPGTRPL